MRILVLSDSHRDAVSLYTAIEREPTAEVVYFLGDGCGEASEAAARYIGKKQFICVKGNCDFCADVPEKDIRTLENTRIYATHGYAENVKFTYQNLYYAAKENGCTLALFGHTHDPYLDYYDGIYLFNPGSLKSGEYGVVDLTEKGLICINKKLIY